MFTDQKKWFPIRYLEAKEIAEQNLCKYTKDAATKDCNSSESAKNSFIYLDFIFNCTLEINLYFTPYISDFASIQYFLFGMNIKMHQRSSGLVSK